MHGGSAISVSERASGRIFIKILVNYEMLWLENCLGLLLSVQFSIWFRWNKRTVRKRLIQYMDMLARGTFSTISYNVFLDLVQWYSLLHTKQMTYSSKVRRCWHIYWKDWWWSWNTLGLYRVVIKTRRRSSEWLKLTAFLGQQTAKSI